MGKINDIRSFEIEPVMCQNCQFVVESQICREGKPTGKEIPFFKNIKCPKCGSLVRITYYICAPRRVREWYDKKIIMGEK